MRLTGPRRSRVLLFIWCVLVSAGVTLATMTIINPTPVTIMHELNTYKVTMYIKTWSKDPEDWIVDAVAEQLEEPEQIESIKVQGIQSVPF